MEEENQISLNKVQHLDSDIFVGILDLFKNYGTTLARNLVDTYTNPFKIVAPNIMFSLDTIETRREGNPPSRVQPDIIHSGKGVYEGDSRTKTKDVIIIPKYNHYMRDPSVWDNTKIYVPKGFLNIDEVFRPEAKPTVSYSFYRTLPNFLPELYHSDLVARWGSYFKAISSIISLSIFTHHELQ